MNIWFLDSNNTLNTILNLLIFVFSSTWLSLSLLIRVGSKELRTNKQYTKTKCMYTLKLLVQSASIIHYCQPVLHSHLSLLRFSMYMIVCVNAWMTVVLVCVLNRDVWKISLFRIEYVARHTPHTNTYIHTLAHTHRAVNRANILDYYFFFGIHVILN